MCIDERFVAENEWSLTELLTTLCRIPAPSNHEEARTKFCHDWLIAEGAKGVYIDSALNTVYPVNCDGRDDLIVFMAHTDTVFPDLEPMSVAVDEENIYCPGVGDDTACLAIMLMVIRYILQRKLTPDRGILFVANSGEEGLGNLKGIRQIMQDYAGRISEVYTFDGQYNAVVNCPVGSRRYFVEAETEGGHSFRKFGNRNAIVVIADLISRLYRIEVPKIGDSKTTYNVGTIGGGTSVNTIAENASILYEYRSDNAECLRIMEEKFREQIERTRPNARKIRVVTVGERPCTSGVDMEHLDRMTKRCIAVCEKYSGIPCVPEKGSTDSNIPMSMGVPSICVGTYLGGGAHTRDEWVEKKSLPIGLRIAGELILDHFF